MANICMAVTERSGARSYEGYSRCTREATERCFQDINDPNASYTRCSAHALYAVWKNHRPARVRETVIVTIGPPQGPSANPPKKTPSKSRDPMRPRQPVQGPSLPGNTGPNRSLPNHGRGGNATPGVHNTSRTPEGTRPITQDHTKDFERRLALLSRDQRQGFDTIEKAVRDFQKSTEKVLAKKNDCDGQIVPLIRGVDELLRIIQSNMTLQYDRTNRQAKKQMEEMHNFPTHLDAALQGLRLHIDNIAACQRDHEVAWTTQTEAESEARNLINVLAPRVATLEQNTGDDAYES